MQLKAVLSNREHPEYGVVTLPCPIPEDEYKHCLELLSELEIGDVHRQDCKIDEIDSWYKTLKQLEGSSANVDELDYLARRLDSFCEGEAEKFEAMAHVLQLGDVKDFINLTFCCQEVTVITDFKNLREAGLEHYLTLNGGGAPVSEYEKQDGEQIALDLIAAGQGKVTPYGVLYDNGMKLEQCYRGGSFPQYLYQPKALDVEFGPSPIDGEYTLLQLPMPNSQLQRMLLRGGYQEDDEFPVDILDGYCPSEVLNVLKEYKLDSCDKEMLRELNQMCKAIEDLSPGKYKKLNAVICFAEPEHPFQIEYLARNLAEFEFVPGVKSPEEYGRFIIEESGHYEYDPNLDEYYNFEKYGSERIERQEGKFNKYGYVSYLGEMSLDEQMRNAPDDHNQGISMGGMV